MSSLAAKAVIVQAPNVELVRPGDHDPVRQVLPLRAIAQRGVAVAEVDDVGQHVPIHPDEFIYIAQAVVQRRREFALGRFCARKALQDLGFPSQAIPRNQDRSPQWPEGVVGSITHVAGYAAAATGFADQVAALGIDAERIGQISEPLEHLIFDQEERTWLASRSRGARSALATVMFSAKEAYYKAWYPITERFLAFHEVRILIGKSDFVAFQPALGPPDALTGGVMGKFTVCQDLVVTCICLIDKGSERRSLGSCSTASAHACSTLSRCNPESLPNL